MGVVLGGSQPVAVELATVPISSANLLAIGTTPKLLVPAVTGKILSPIYATMLYQQGSQGYTGITEFVVGLGATGAFVDASFLELGDGSQSGFVGGAGSQYLPFGPALNPTVFASVNPALLANAGIYLENEGNALTGGNGTAIMYVLYFSFDAP